MLLLMSFSTRLPVPQLADAFIELFDAMATGAVGSLTYMLKVELPAGRLELPGPGADFAPWADDAAARIWATQPGTADERDVSVLAVHLAHVAADSATREPAVAAVLVPEPSGPVAVILETWPLLPDEGQPLVVGEPADSLRQPHPDLLRPAEVGVLDHLAVGPAARSGDFGVARGTGSSGVPSRKS